MLVLLSILLLHAAPLSGSADSRMCPSGSIWHGTIAQNFATQAQYGQVRAETGLGGAAASTLRLLTDSHDVAVCQQLNALVAPGGAIGPSDHGPWAYYSFGGKYLLVSGTAPAPGSLTTGYDVLAVVDGQFNVLDVILV